MPIQLSLFGDNNSPFMYPRETIKDSFMDILKPKDVEIAFCVVEWNEARGSAIWGIGESTGEAIEDAVKWASAFSMHHADYDIDDAADLLNDSRFKIYPCSPKVHRKVEEYGGEIDFVIEKGRVVLPKEIKAA